jgi:hypothetical protein
MTVVGQHKDCDVVMPPTSLTMAGRNNNNNYSKDDIPASSFEEKEERRRRDRGRGLQSNIPRHDDNKQQPPPITTIIIKIKVDDVNTVFDIDAMRTTTNMTIAPAAMTSLHCAEGHLLVYVFVVSSCSCRQERRRQCKSTQTTQQ